MPEAKTAVASQYDSVREAVPEYLEQVDEVGREDVPPGYKRTEVGIIPEDWDVVHLDSVGAYPVIKAGPFGSSLTKASYSRSGFKVYGQEQVIRGDYLFGDYFISEKKYRQLRSCSVTPGDILISLVGTAGKALLIPNGAPSGIINPRLVRIRLNEDQVNPLFFKHLFESSQVQSALVGNAQGGTMDVLNANILRALYLPIPPLPEQNAIATTLSDTDALIESLDRLIAKKRATKQATMQQLLTGQTRLPGFEGEWETKRLGNHLSFLKTGTNSRAELTRGEGVAYLHYGDIHTTSASHLDCTAVAMPSIPHDNVRRLDRLQAGDLVFVDASEDLDGVGKSVEITKLSLSGLVAGLHTIAARFDKSVLADGFKGYLQFHPSFQETLRRLAAGTKVFATNRRHIADVEIELPPSEEQTAIAAVLFDMDTEIKALERRRDKARQIKQGMMQQLLTGQARLVMPAKETLSQVKHRSGRGTANVYFMRSVLAAEIIDQLHGEPTFGHVKFEKILYLVERLCEIDTGSNYHRKAAGPYDNRALRSIDTQLRRQKWFDAHKKEGRYQYVPLQNRGAHKIYFDRYYSGVAGKFKEIIKTFRGLNTESCEIVATLFSAWNDLLRNHAAVSDEMIVHEVLNNWHESKKRISKDRWLRALTWMRTKGFVPKGAA